MFFIACIVLFFAAEDTLLYQYYNRDNLLTESTFYGGRHEEGGSDEGGGDEDEDQRPAGHHHVGPLSLAPVSTVGSPQSGTCQDGIYLTSLSSVWTPSLALTEVSGMSRCSASQFCHSPPRSPWG